MRWTVRWVWVKGMDEGHYWGEDTHPPEKESTRGRKVGIPLIHSYAHGAGRQVSKSSERVRLEKHVLMVIKRSNYSEKLD